MTKSSRFVVATHCLTLLAYGEGEAMTSDYIAGSVNTNPVVVRRILSLLAKAGLIVTQEGSGGGVRLAKAASKIDLRTVFAAVDSEDLFAPHPQDPNPLCPVGSAIKTILEPTLDAAAEALLGTLAETSVAELLRRVKRLSR